LTVSATWSKATLLLPLLLAACQSPPEPAAVAPPQPLPPLQQPQLDPGVTEVPSLPAGLTPLPTPQEVVTAQPVGRPDPFAPLPATASTSGAAAVPVVPQGFRFNGVIRSGHQAQALVQFGADSGSLRVGDVGGRSTRLLPPGWAVGGIDVARGHLILRASGQAVRLSLDPPG
jgi:hypothetical protein